MPPRSTSADNVETRMLTPTPEVDESPQLLYRAIPEQLTPENIPFKIEFVPFTAQMAQESLDAADANEEFRQRKRTPARMNRWLNLMRTGRFVHYLPDGPICYNPDGVQLNGGNRLAAVAQHDEPVGFMVIRNCPTWMFQHFDSGDKRSVSESIYMNKHDIKGQPGALARLGMRYEEFLSGKRSPLGWAMWGKHRDENADINDFLDRREYLTDFTAEGARIKKRSDLMAVSGTVFVAYQRLAWPDGEEQLEEFLDGLCLGAMLAKGNPALTLREWAKRDGYIGAASLGRREGHLLLLFKMFASFVQHATVSEIRVARGFPMTMPYHPKGHEVAVDNVRAALEKMDRESGR